MEEAGCGRSLELTGRKRQEEKREGGAGLGAESQPRTVRKVCTPRGGARF